MPKATETQINAYQRQWEAMSDREVHAVQLAQMASAFMDLFESGKTIAWIIEAFSPTHSFTASEVEFAIIASKMARENVINSLAKQIFKPEALAAAMAEHQVKHETIELELLHSAPESPPATPEPESLRASWVG